MVLSDYFTQGQGTINGTNISIPMQPQRQQGQQSFGQQQPDNSQSPPQKKKDHKYNPGGKRLKKRK